MTEFSWYFECTDVGDGEPLTINDMVNENMFFGDLDPAGDGVIYWTSTVIPEGITSAPTGLLAPTNPGGSTVRIASGVAVVEGRIYVNDANVDFEGSGGNASAVDLIVLRYDADASTVRLAQVRAGASSTATVTQNATIWEIPIAYVTLDGNGDFSSLADARGFARSQFKTFANPLNRQGGSATAWGTVGTNNYSERKTVMQVGAVRWTGSADTSGTVTITFPVAFSDTPLVFAVGRNGSGANNVAVNVSAVSATQATLFWLFTSSTSLDFFWWAIGPE